ncbi:MAG: NAD(P)/FAD-dependent oxidoreductase [Betaproteobacteria bacterium]|nr:MAG: NAD(P)/FAD-dependent oxidoreductase [Betaproteobacteria bacterium]
MTITDNHFDAIIIGAGAAGLFCAARAGQRGKRVALIDHAEKLGEKIRISGGGRCNFTNLHTTPANFLSQNPHFCRSALARYTPQDFIALVRSHGIAFHEKTLGQLFCDESSQQIIDMLIDECRSGNVTVIHPATIDVVTRGDQYQVLTSQGLFRGDSLVVATGGLSIPAIGATGFGYEIAKQFNVPLTPLRAGLVPLALDAPELERYGMLSGVAFETTARTDAANATFNEAALLTHKGLSGPAVLQISSYWNAGDAVLLDLLPGIDAADWLSNARSNNIGFAKALAAHVPTRLADAWAHAHAPNHGEKAITQWTRAELDSVAALLNSWSLKPSGTLGYKKAEVTLGGVDTKALSQQTMMAKGVPGLHFIGEVVDVTGWLGGYNFQWAWASAAACGDAL